MNNSESKNDVHNDAEYTSCKPSRAVMPLYAMFKNLAFKY